MTNQADAGDGEDVATLPVLIRTRMAERDWNTGDLERRAGGSIPRQRWSAFLKDDDPPANFPTPRVILAMATALEVDVTTVLFAIATTLNLPVRRTGSIFAHLIPSGVEVLPQQTQDSLLNHMRALVHDFAETGLTLGDDDVAQ